MVVYVLALILATGLKPVDGWFASVDSCLHEARRYASVSAVCRPALLVEIH